MTAKTIAAIALAASTLLITATAEAGSRDHGNKNHYRSQHHHRNWNHNDHDRHGFGIYVSDYRSHKTCGYYKWKAYDTGYRYWWRKYERCIVRYY